MARAYSQDLRDRVIDAALAGLPARHAAARFGIGDATAIVWVRRAMASSTSIPKSSFSSMKRGRRRTWRARAGAPQRLRASVPHGHWKTTTFVAGLRRTGLTAPLILDGPINGLWSQAYADPVSSTVAPFPPLDLSTPSTASRSRPPTRWP